MAALLELSWSDRHEMSAATDYSTKMLQQTVLNHLNEKPCEKVKQTRTNRVCGQHSGYATSSSVAFVTHSSTQS